MDFYSITLGFGFGGVGGAVLADFLHMTWMATPMFLLGGVIGAVLCSGMFGEVGDLTNLFS